MDKGPSDLAMEVITRASSKKMRSQAMVSTIGVIKKYIKGSGGILK